MDVVGGVRASERLPHDDDDDNDDAEWAYVISVFRLFLITPVRPPLPSRLDRLAAASRSRRRRRRRRAVTVPAPGLSSRPSADLLSSCTPRPPLGGRVPAGIEPPSTRSVRTDGPRRYRPQRFRSNQNIVVINNPVVVYDGPTDANSRSFLARGTPARRVFFSFTPRPVMTFMSFYKNDHDPRHWSSTV